MAFGRIKYNRIARRRSRASAASTIQKKWRSRKTNRKLRSYTSGNLHSFRRVEFKANQSITTDVNGFGALAYDFQLQDISDYLAFPALFDQYKLHAVSVELIPLNNTYPLPNVQPQIGSSTDFDDSTPPTSMEKLLCRTGSKMRPFHRKVSTYLRPKVASVIDNPLPATTYGFQPKYTWLDLTSPVGSTAMVPHYGYKIAFQASAFQEIVYHQKVTYYMKFKEPVVR